jgi:hypothetical protein
MPRLVSTGPTLLQSRGIRLTMHHYTDLSRLPVAEAINALPTFGSEAKDGNYTQIRTRNPDSAGTEQSRRDTAAPEGEPSKVIQPERF